MRSWYEDPTLLTPTSFRAKAVRILSFCSSLCIGIGVLLILPVILIVLILFLLLWILPGFGYFYERYAEARDRKRYYPPVEEMKPWGPHNKLIHVVHVHAPQSKLPSIVYLSGMSISMYYVKPLLSEFVKFMSEPVEILSFDPPGYGASESPSNWNEEDLTSELSLLHEIIGKSTLRKPFILIGGSIGGLLAHLYYLTYPKDVAGIIFLDPTPPSVFEQGSTTLTNMNRLVFVLRVIARAASYGCLRPIIFLFDYFGLGDFGNFFRPSYPGYIALAMTQTMINKFTNQMQYYQSVPDYILKQKKNTSILNDVPLLVISAPDSSKARLCGYRTEEEAQQWWCDHQRAFLHNSSNTGFIFREDHNHVHILGMVFVTPAIDNPRSMVVQSPGGAWFDTEFGTYP
ncbi:unnamed protein product, partial [Rotaria magnacalcarata]